MLLMRTFTAVVIYLVVSFRTTAFILTLKAGLAGNYRPTQWSSKKVTITFAAVHGRFLHETQLSHRDRAMRCQKSKTTVWPAVGAWTCERFLSEFHSSHNHRNEEHSHSLGGLLRSAGHS